jgi:DNA-nicking Smr family endonuclease
MEEYDPEEEVVVPVEDSLDLHTFRPQEVKDLLDDYLQAALEKGFEEVRIIHGKGTGVLRERVQSLLKRHPLVAAFEQAQAASGGWGATVVRLRKKTEQQG